MPAAALLIIHNKHVIGKNFAETEFGLILRLLFGIGRERHRNIVHDFILHQSSVFRELWGKTASNRSGSIVSPHVHNVKGLGCRNARKKVFFTKELRNIRAIFAVNMQIFHISSIFQPFHMNNVPFKKGRFRVPF